MTHLHMCGYLAPIPGFARSPHMRAALFLLAASLVSSAGCSWWVISRGTDLSKLPTREQVQAVFGPPRASGEVEGKSYEDFRTHRKIADFNLEGVLMVDAGTLGLAELYCFPCAVFIAAKQSIAGQNLRFIYDENGKVKEVRRDGECLLFHSSTDTP